VIWTIGAAEVGSSPKVQRERMKLIFERAEERGMMSF